MYFLYYTKKETWNHEKIDRVRGKMCYDDIDCLSAGTITTLQ